MGNINKQMRGLIVAPQPFFSPRGTPFSVYYRTLITAQLGAKLDFLTYGEGQDVDIPNVHFIRIFHFHATEPIRIGPSFLKLFYDFFIMLRMIGLLIRNRYDFVHAHEEAVFIACLLRPFFRFKLIYDMHSSLPQQLENFKFTKLKGVIRLFQILENHSLRVADAIITICPDLSNYVEKNLPDSGKNHLIENSLFSPVKLKINQQSSKASYTHPAVEKFRDENDHLVVYAGTLEPYQGVDILVQSIVKVLRHHSNTGYLIAGGTPAQVKQYRKMAVALGVENHVLFTGRVSQEAAKFFCSLASVLVSPRSSGTNTPLKIYEQLASSIPIVATKIYSHTQVLTDDVAFFGGAYAGGYGHRVL